MQNTRYNASVFRTFPLDISHNLPPNIFTYERYQMFWTSTLISLEPTETNIGFQMLLIKLSNAFEWMSFFCTQYSLKVFEYY